ncbi:MAG: hypothetical protein SF066_21665 [Thermoanaerobaculia bacterium]|nr:hypothetical protein [Thermoanaerobaculia bacterium]
MPKLLEVLLALGLLAAPAAQAQLEVRFRVIPERDFRGPNTPSERFLADGEIRLYRLGEFRARHVLRPGETATLSPGEWQWIAEAPGWVSARVVDLVVPAAAGKPRSLRLDGRLVSACTVDLAPRARWPGTERVALVSLEHGSTFPLPLDFRTSLQVPAGRWLAYSVGARGLLGVSDAQTCSPGARIALATLTPPAREVEHWLVQVEWPVELEPRLEDFEVTARSPIRSGPPPIRARHWARHGRQATFFFFDIPTTTDRLVTVRHPRLRTLDHVQPVLGGRAAEVGPIVLKPRRSLTAQIDFRPARDHRSARLVLVDCGLRPSVLGDGSAPDCKERDRFERKLLPGVAEYRFDHLDDGQYRFDAEIDDEIVWGLGEAAHPRLDVQDDLSPEPWVTELREFHVAGQLLEEGDPVAGFVRLYSPPESHRPAVLLPTDDDGFYHLYYFGHRPREDRLAEAWNRLAASSRTLDPERRFSACSADGRCRVFNGASSIVGEGRWDIELGRGDTVEVLVLDADTGTPVPDVVLGLPASPATHFLNGRVIETAPDSPRYSDSIATDENGRAVFRWRGLKAIPLVVFKGGYEPAQAEARPRPGEMTTVEVRIFRRGSGPPRTENPL